VLQVPPCVCRCQLWFQNKQLEIRASAALTKFYSSEKTKSVMLSHINCTASNLTEYVFKECTLNKNCQLELINCPITFPISFLKVKGRFIFQSDMLALPPRYSFFKASPKSHLAITYYRKHNIGESEEAKRRLCISPENVSVYCIIINNIR